MPANPEDVREWMAEGDRLMAQAYDYLHGGADDPLQLDLAGRHFSRAARYWRVASSISWGGRPAAAGSESTIRRP